MLSYAVLTAITSILALRQAHASGTATLKAVTKGAVFTSESVNMIKPMRIYESPHSVGISRIKKKYYTRQPMPIQKRTL